MLRPFGASIYILSSYAHVVKSFASLTQWGIQKFNTEANGDEEQNLNQWPQTAVLTLFKGALDKYNIIPQLFQKKVGIFIP